LLKVEFAYFKEMTNGRTRLGHNRDIFLRKVEPGISMEPLRLPAKVAHKKIAREPPAGRCIFPALEI
jgi:hypothetical protein